MRCQIVLLRGSFKIPPPLNTLDYKKLRGPMDKGHGRIDSEIEESKKGLEIRGVDNQFRAGRFEILDLIERLK